MKRIIASSLAALMTLTAMNLALSQTAPTSATDGLDLVDIYFIGKRLSQIEPCGCQTKQRGGMQFEAALYDKNPNHPSIRVDAGEWTRTRIDMAPLESLKTRYVLRG